MSVVQLMECRVHRRGWLSLCGVCLASLFTVTTLRGDQKGEAKTSDNESDAVDEPIYEVGGDVKPPRVLHSVTPEFTPKAREQHIEGSVILATVITSKGEPRRIHVEKSLEASLDQKAIEALKQWQFSPGQKDDKPVATRVSIEIRFNVL